VTFWPAAALSLRLCQTVIPAQAGIQKLNGALEFNHSNRIKKADWLTGSI